MGVESEYRVVQGKAECKRRGSGAVEPPGARRVPAVGGRCDLLGRRAQSCQMPRVRVATYSKAWAASEAGESLIEACRPRGVWGFGRFGVRSPSRAKGSRDIALCTGWCAALSMFASPQFWSGPQALLPRAQQLLEGPRPRGPLTQCMSSLRSGAVG